MDTVKHIAIDDQRNISKIYIKFDHNNAVLKRISMKRFAHELWMGAGWESWSQHQTYSK